MRVFKIFTVLMLVALVSACGTKVKILDEDDEIYLSGNWNDSDSKLVSKKMVYDVLEHSWLKEFKDVNHRSPAIIVGKVRNRSQELISTETFISDIERELVESGRVLFVASKGERVEVREERIDMDLNASEHTRKPMGEELGADLILQGSVSSIIDSKNGEEIRFYQVDLSLISLVNNVKVWVGQKKIKKHVAR